jgi:hypothetical protein
MNLICIDSNYFGVACVIQNGVCIRAADIVKYMIGWTDKRILRYAANKRWIAYINYEIQQ